MSITATTSVRIRGGEANAIGTEYVRAGLLSPSDAARIQAQLKKYVDLRMLFYRTRNGPELQLINADTTRLQNEMWLAVQDQASQNPTPIMALVVSGMNDVLNSQGYTQAAWWNRIPTSAWGLLILTAICCNVLVGTGGRRATIGSKVSYRSANRYRDRVSLNRRYRRTPWRTDTRISSESGEFIRVATRQPLAPNSNVVRPIIGDVRHRHHAATAAHPRAVVAARLVEGLRALRALVAHLLLALQIGIGLRRRLPATAAVR